MRNFLLASLIVITDLTGWAFAQNRTVVWSGLDMELAQTVDPMTDAKACTLSIGPVSWSVVLVNDKEFFVTPVTAKWTFAPDEQHLIRVGTEKALPLSLVTKRNVLTVNDAVSSARVVRAIVSGDQEIKIRAFKFPSREVLDLAINNPNVGFVYRRAVDACGWRNLGISGELKPAKLSVYEPSDPDPAKAGYATVHVVGNDELSLQKGFDKYGGGCTINVGVSSLFGMRSGKWINDKIAVGNESLLIRDADSKQVFLQHLPEHYDGPGMKGGVWPQGLEAARAAWRATPLGSIELQPLGPFKTKSLLYGFHELWSWGTQHCGFPAIE